MSIPVMDNCCTCKPIVDGGFMKRAVAVKTWPHFGEVPAWARGSWTANGVRTPTWEYPGTDIDYTEIVAAMANFPGGGGGDGFVQTHYLTQTSVGSGYWFVNEGFPPPGDPGVVGYYGFTIVRTFDRRDGRCVAFSITFSGDDTLSGYPFAGKGPYSYSLADDGTVTETGDTSWAGNVDQDGSADVNMAFGIILVGQNSVTTASVTLTATTMSGSCSGWYEGTDFAGSFSITLSDDYSAGACRSDVLAMLATIDVGSLSVPGRLVDWYRLEPGSGGISLRYTDADVLGYPSALIEVGALGMGGVGLPATAVKSLIALSVAQDLLCVEEELCEPATAQYAGDGHPTQVTGVSAYHADYVTPPSREIGPGDIGYTYGFANVET